jgi:septal ring factor EnvC (AmiA/AmiB activator)
MMRTFAIAVLLASSMAEKAETEAGVNPIRKVVTMLQMMMNKIEAEGKKETELHDKYMCYCETSEGTLSDSIEEAQTKIPQLEADIKEAGETKVKLEGDITAHQTDRAAAKEAMATASTMREKEAAAYLKESTTDKSNLDALTKALAAIEKGMAGEFLQTSAAQILRKLSVSKVDMVDMDRQTLVSFLSGSQEHGYAPASAEIVGILKQMKDEFEKDIAEEDAAEAASIQSFEEMMAAKKKEVESLTMAIEEKMTRVGELGVEIATMKNDLEDTEEGLGEDIKFLEDLKKNCGIKAKEWEAICKARSDELLALTETIKILNDDDALELFKKTIPSASFLQIQDTTAAVRARARAALAASPHRSPQIDFVQLYLSGKKAGFEKVIALIDEMVALLKKEQIEDDNKKEYCDTEFDMSEDKKKELERSISDTEKAIDETKEMLSTVGDEIVALEAAIAATDKEVAEATEQRKEENADYLVLMANNKAAKELILFAKNRMQKFYNPKLYKPPPKRELTEEERITLNMGGTLAPTNPPGGIAGTGVSFAQIRTHERVQKDAPPPPPPGASAHKKSEASGGVLAMMDMLVADIDKEMLNAKMEEKDSQDDYEKLMFDCSEKRASDSQALTDKTAAKADGEAQLQSLNDGKEALGTELKGVLDYITSLHGECDFLLEYYTQRKEARASEIDAMGKAKDVLKGADYSLLQTGAKVKSLRGQTSA